MMCITLCLWCKTAYQWMIRCDKSTALNAEELAGSNVAADQWIGGSYLTNRNIICYLFTCIILAIIHSIQWLLEVITVFTCTCLFLDARYHCVPSFVIFHKIILHTSFFLNFLYDRRHSPRIDNNVLQDYQKTSCIA